jgi:AMMECR1 domain-containing protein
MSRSVLLQLARDSIQEVIEANNTIDKQALLQEYPQLAQNIPTTLKIFIQEELHGSCILDGSNSLLENVIIAAKKAAFEDENSKPITTSEYLHCHLELTLNTPEGVISQTDEPILK